MEGNVTVNQAISRGKWLIRFPMLVIFMGVIFGKFLFFKSHYGRAFDIFFIISAGIALCWLYWSLTIPIWKIWAYTNVRNVHELKLKAIKNGILSKDESFFGKTEIKSYQQRETLKQLDKKFLAADVYDDDRTIGAVSNIYYSKTKLAYESVFMVFCAVGMVYLVWESDLIQKKGPGLFFAVVLMGLFIFTIFNNLKKINNPNPQIILSNKGIQLKNTPMVPWNEIQGEIAYGRWSGKYYRKCLEFNGQETMINDYAVSIKELEELLHTYRTRYEKGNPA